MHAAARHRSYRCCSCFATATALLLLLLLLLYLQQLLLLLLLLAPWLLLYVVYDALHRRYHLVIWRTCGCSAILYPKRSVPFSLYSVLYPYPSVYFS
jgi:hypothetical protein